MLITEESNHENKNQGEMGGKSEVKCDWGKNIIVIINPVGLKTLCLFPLILPSKVSKLSL